MMFEFEDSNSGTLLPDYEREKLQKREYLQLMEQLSTFNPSLRPPNEKLWSVRAARAVIGFMYSYIMDICYEEGVLEDGFRIGSRKFNLFSLIREGKAKPMSRTSKFIEILCIFIYFKQFILLMFHRDYNRKWYAYTYYGNKTMTIGEDKELLQIKQDYLEARSLLKQWGAPLINLNFAYEFSASFWYSNQTFGHFYLIYDVYFGHMLDYGIMRMILNVRDQYRFNFEMIREEVNFFIRSCCIHAKEKWAKYGLVVEIRDDQLITSEFNEIIESINRELIREHLGAIKSIKSLALRGCLQPLNMTRKAVERYALFYVPMLFVSIIMNFILALYLIGIVPYFSPVSQAELETDPLDLVVLLEMVIIHVVSCTIFSLAMAFALASWLMSASYVRKLRNLIISSKQRLSLYKRAILLNQSDDEFENFGMIQTEAVGSTFIEYRIFLRQLGSLKRLTKLATFVLFWIGAVPPVNAYFLSKYDKIDCLRRNAIFSFMSTILVDTLLVPMCHMNVRCLQLNKELSGLLALLVDLDAMVNERKLLRVRRSMANFKREYLFRDSHTTWIMRNSIDWSYPYEQFTVKFFGMALTYGNLLRIHFWIGALVLPTIIIDHKFGAASSFVFL